jgi:hypothetical protein
MLSGGNHTRDALRARRSWHLQLLLAAQAVDRRRTMAALSLFDEVRAMTWRLLHPRP